MDIPDDAGGVLMRALHFAAQKHRAQRRKGEGEIPYINHPIAVAEILWREGGVRDGELLAAALLHDTVEDTATTPEELEENFGVAVCRLVLEVTDDKEMHWKDRKQAQIDKSSSLSERAKALKLADKCCNIYDAGAYPPDGWSHDRRRTYLDWAEKVVEGARGCNAGLEALFDANLKRSRKILDAALEKP